MIARYSVPEFVKLWSDETKYECWFKVEMAICKAMQEEGLIPPGTVEAIELSGFKLDPKRIEELEKITNHDVVAFLRHIEESIGEPAKWIHFGVTSSDICDTAFALLLKEACELINSRIDKFMKGLSRRVWEFAHTPMIGRTHGQHAEVTTFGLALASHFQEMDRARIRLTRAASETMAGTISGAVGTYAQISPVVEYTALVNLHLFPETVPTQVVARDRYAALFCAFGLVAAAIERLATSIRHWQRTEVGEVREGFTKGQTGSSAMPHKRNPISSENLCGLSRVVRSAITPAIENIALWHERDISHSSVERMIAPDITTTLAYMLDRATSLIENLQVDEVRMLHNINMTNGLVFSETVMLELVRAGMAKKQAYEKIQRHALNGNGSFQHSLESDQEVMGLLGEEKLARCFDLKHHLRHVNTILGSSVPKVGA